MITIGVPMEIFPGERRVSSSPETVTKMVNSGFKVLVETGAGLSSYIDDLEFKRVGAAIESNKAILLEQADIILKVNCPIFDEKYDKNELDMMKQGAIIISRFSPLKNNALISKLNENKLTLFSLDSCSQDCSSPIDGYFKLHE